MFNNMTIKSRLMFVISMLSLLLIGIGSLGLYGINQSNAGLKSVYEDRTVPAVQLGKILDVWYQVRRNAIDAASSKNIEVAKARTEDALKLVKQNEGVWAQYLATKLTPEEAALAKTKGEQYVQYVESLNRTLQLASAGDFEAAALNASTDAAPKFSALRETMFTLLDLQGTVAAQEYATAQGHYENIFMTSVVVMILGVSLAIIVGFFLIRAIVGPLNEAIAVANAVAAGDLTSRIE
ncbi:MAG: MCP four helix bundle domain-containing protein, partial [Nitrosomonas sp.]|nr:MCP four helix bundle domain-containing protein [Nitrosomonas sp.]